MASRSFPPQSRRGLVHLLRNGATVEATEENHLQLAHALAQAGLVQLATRRYLRCVWQNDEDYLDVPNPGCEGRIALDRLPAACPACGRTVEYPGIDKAIFVETAIELDNAGIAGYLWSTLTADGGVVAMTPVNAFACQVTLAGGGTLVLFLADALGRAWQSPAGAGGLAHLAVVAGAVALKGNDTTVSLADWLTHDGAWRRARLARVAGASPLAAHLAPGDPGPGDHLPPVVAAGTQLDIRIDACGEAGYPVEFSLGGIRDFQGLAAAALPSMVTSRTGGRTLFDWLCHDPALAAAWHVAGEAPLPLHIRLRLGAPELHALPWEAMQAPIDGAWVELAASGVTPFARYLAHSGRPRRAVSQRPVRLLVAVAAPADLAEQGMAPIDRGGEWQNLQQALEQTASTADYLLESCTLAAIERRLRNGYHCLHLVAHGAESDGSPYLMLEDECGKLAPVSGIALAEMVNRVATGGMTALRLVFLNACHSAATVARGELGNLAAALIRAGVPAVVVMQGAVDTETSRRFAHEFYRQLLQHGIVDLAANQARATLLTRMLPGSAIPLLYLRLPDGCLFR